VKPECDSNLKKGNITDVTCGFENVDFARGGIYHGSADEPRSGEGVEVYQRTCTLQLTPCLSRSNLSTSKLPTVSHCLSKRDAGCVV
jgi:hypothetical protein